MTSVSLPHSSPPPPQRRRRQYRRIDPEAVHQTVLRLEVRIGERFPDSNLRGVAQDLIEVSKASYMTVRRIRRPILSLRLASWVLVAGLLAVLGTIPVRLRLGQVDTVTEFVSMLEPTLSSLFFISALVLFLLSLEARAKRRRTLTALHELRALAHVIDMHQLTKDPAVLLRSGPATAHSPHRTFTPFELGRYLDYCTEMLSLIGKIAALYVQDFPDEPAVRAVNDIEDLTTGLSRKIWQKIMLIREDLPAAPIAPIAGEGIGHE